MFQTPFVRARQIQGIEETPVPRVVLFPRLVVQNQIIARRPPPHDRRQTLDRLTFPVGQSRQPRFQRISRLVLSTRGVQTQPQIQVGLRALRVRGPKPSRDRQVLAQALLVQQVAHQPDRRRHVIRIVAQRRPIVLDHQLLVALARALDRGVIVQVGAAVAGRFVVVHQPQLAHGRAAEQG